MATNTPNLSLTNPEYGKGEKYNLALWVANNNKIDVAVGNKVEKEVGKTLSTNDYTDLEKQKLNTDIPAQLAEKVQNFKIKNEVLNGAFSQGTTGFTGSQATVAVVSGEGEITSAVAGGTSYGININNLNLLSNHKYYVAYKIKPFRTHIPSFWAGISVNVGKTVMAGIMTNVSAIFQITTDRQSITFYGNATSLTDLIVGSKVAFDNFIIIDITKTFGTGNEPTKLEMDELIKIIPNQWWEGELTLTQKQFITWQLNLIRKNTNAIIALGGTII